MDKRIKLIINIILDVACCGLALYLPFFKLAHSTTKEYLIAGAFVLIGLYFAYSAVTKLIYLIKSGRE